MSSDASVNRLNIYPWQWVSLAAGIIALAICVCGSYFDSAQFFRAYLTAYLFIFGLSLGSMILLMVYYLTGGSWGYIIRRILEAGMRTLPLVAITFVPIAFGLKYMYPWAQPELVAQSEKLQYQQFYLAPAYFWIRAAIYFILWLLMAGLFSSWSKRQDRSGDGQVDRYNLNLSGYGAVVYGISIHFAAVDWAMSIEPVFHSTIWGPLFAVGQLVSAFSFAIIVLAIVIHRKELADVASTQVLNDLGSLLFTFIVLWAYLAWFQFMLVWIANMYVDVIWYFPRLGIGWIGVIWVICLLHFVVPFFLLLLRFVKRNSRILGCVAGLVLLMQLVFMYYQIMPNFNADRISEHWMDFLTPIGLGGIWLAYFMWQLHRYPLLPAYDYNRSAALRLRRMDEEEVRLEHEISS